MSKAQPTVNVNYYDTTMTATKVASETYTVPNGGLKASDLAKLITSQHPNTAMGGVLERSRRSVDSQMVYDSFTLKGGEDVLVIPRLYWG